jgi:hypothetical protein
LEYKRRDLGLIVLDAVLSLPSISMSGLFCRISLALFFYSFTVHVSFGFCSYPVFVEEEDDPCTYGTSWGFFHFTKTVRFVKKWGHFRKVRTKNASAAHVGAFPSHQTEQLNGRGWIADFFNFLGCNWINLNIGTKIKNSCKHQGVNCSFPKKSWQ